MATYATAEQVLEYLADSDVELSVERDGAGELLPSPRLERLIAHAERDVDRAIGGPPIPLATGLRLDPTTLPAAQRAALSRAVGAAVEYRLSIDPEALVGADDFLPGGDLTVLRRASRPPGPRVLEELAGYGLVKRSGCALPDPPAA